MSLRGYATWLGPFPSKLLFPDTSREAPVSVTLDTVRLAILHLVDRDRHTVTKLTCVSILLSKGRGSQSIWGCMMKNVPATAGRQFIAGDRGHPGPGRQILGTAKAQQRSCSLPGPPAAGQSGAIHQHSVRPSSSRLRGMAPSSTAQGWGGG